MKYSSRLFCCLLLQLTILLGSCAFPPDKPEQRVASAERLALEIMALSPVIDRQEAHDFALAAVETSADLGKKYQVALMPWLHNASIVVGLKERGYCYQYADDLYERLKNVRHENLEMHYVLANYGEIGEHHALTVTVKDAAWDSGLVLDAWRHNGNLFFGPLKQDKYPWLDDGVASFTPAAD